MDAPRLLHYCWFGKHAKPPDVVRCQASWARHLGGYELLEWNESNSPLDREYLKAAYARGLWSKVSNLVRLEALWRYGGIYLDTDIEVLKTFDDLLGEGCVVGFQHEHHDRDWVNNAVLIAKPGHPFLKDCIDLTLDHFNRTGEFLRSPTVTTTVLKERGLARYGTQRVKDVLVLEADYFYPVPYWQTHDALKPATRSYCTHHWHFSWKDRAGGTKTATPKPAPSRLKRLKRAFSGALLNLAFLRQGRAAAPARRALETVFALFRRPFRPRPERPVRRHAPPARAHLTADTQAARDLRTGAASVDRLDHQAQVHILHQHRLR
jgi:hypothetical protein